MSENQLEVVKLAGSPYDIGYQHGQAGGKRIRDFLQVIVNHGREFMPGLTMEKACAQARLYIPSIEAYAPHLSNEIKGIAEGAAITVDQAYLLQVRAEFTQLTVEEKPAGEGCTSFALCKNITEDGEVWVGQNLDLAPFYKPFGVILHITPKTGPVILCYSQVGSLAHMGINSAGIGWAANALYSSGWRPGVPRPILYRLILEKENLRDAVRVLTDAKRASSCNYLLCHASGEIKDIEVTPDQYGTLDPDGDVLIHANHYRHPEMVPFEKRPKDKLENSKFRENRFRELVTGDGGKLNLEKLKEFLADHQLYPRSVCTHAEGTPWNIATVGAMIAQPSRALMHVALGQACQKQYVTYSIGST